MKDSFIRRDAEGQQGNMQLSIKVKKSKCAKIMINDKKKLFAGTGERKKKFTIESKSHDPQNQQGTNNQELAGKDGTIETLNGDSNLTIKGENPKELMVYQKASDPATTNNEESKEISLDDSLHN